MQRRWNHVGHERASILTLGLLLLGLTFADSAEGPLPSHSALSTDEIVQRLVAANAHRTARLRGYRGKRLYKLDYDGIFGGHAEMQVEANYQAPNDKSFRILSESGSKLLNHRVLLKLLESERHAQEEQNREALEISPTNYEFRLETIQHTPAGVFYVLEVKPISKSKYVYKGRIWVDAADFAVARMDGTPARNPSFWVSHVEVQYAWTKIDGFWLPTHNYSVTEVRLGGRAVLNIDYSDYEIVTESQPTRPVTTDEKTVLPNPTLLSVEPP